MKLRTLGMVAFAAASSCTAVGPQTSAILSSDRAVPATRAVSPVAATEAPRFALVEVDRNVAFTVNSYDSSVTAFFADTGHGKVAIETGDVLAVSLVSLNENGYLDFANATVSPIATTPFPPQIVSDAGTINVPPIGRIEARGRTLEELEQALTERLGQVLVNPTVVVDLVQRNAAVISVVGAVGAPGAFAYTSGSARIRDLIARAGGVTGNINALDVALTRSGTTRRLPLKALLEEARYNIHIRPGDVISIEPRDAQVVVLGAARNNQSVRFDEDGTSLADILGRTGGLQNRQSDPTGVFLYRPISRTLATMLGVDVSRLPGEEVLAVFNFDLSDPTGFFQLGAFEARDGDILFLADSTYEQLSSILDLFTSTADAISTGQTLSGN